MAKRPASLNARSDANAATRRIEKLRYPRTDQALYMSAEWKRARMVILSRNPVCVACNNAVATDVDHIVPLRDGGARLDGANLQPLCRECHSRKTANEAMHGAGVPEWLRPSACNLTIVCGAPGSGKSTWVARHASDGETIIDLDVIRSDISGLPMYHGDAGWLRASLAERNRRLACLASAPPDQKAWFIVSAPRAEDRQRWREILCPRRVVVIETQLDECLLRIRRDPRRSGMTADHMGAAVRWWRKYRRLEGETLVTAAHDGDTRPQTGFVAKMAHSGRVGGGSDL